jgi:hypothetical protein
MLNGLGMYFLKKIFFAYSLTRYHLKLVLLPGGNNSTLGGIAHVYNAMWQCYFAKVRA